MLRLLLISLSKDTEIDFQNKVVKVKCKINQVVETASIDRAVIYISKTKLVDNVAKIAEKSFTNLTRVSMNSLST